MGDVHSEAEILKLSREECLDLLAAHRFGRLAVCTGSGPPLIRPVNYSFDKPTQSVVFRTATGSKFHALIRSAQASFEIDGIDRGSRTGWSVIIHGVTDEVTNTSEIHRLDATGLGSLGRPGTGHTGSTFARGRFPDGGSCWSHKP